VVKKRAREWPLARLWAQFVAVSMDWPPQSVCRAIRASSARTGALSSPQTGRRESSGCAMAKLWRRRRRLSLGRALDYIGSILVCALECGRKGDSVTEAHRLAHTRGAPSLPVCLFASLLLCQFVRPTGRASEPASSRAQLAECGSLSLSLSV